MSDFMPGQEHYSMQGKFIERYEMKYTHADITFDFEKGLRNFNYMNEKNIKAADKQAGKQC